MKKYKWLIILIAIIVFLVSIIFIFSEDESKYIKDITINKVIKMKENEETFILYIKQTTCEHCKTFTPRFASALKEKGLKAYSLNLTNLTEEEKELYDKKFKVDGTPTVLFFIEGNESMIKVEGNQNKDRIIEKFKSVGLVK